MVSQVGPRGPMGFKGERGRTGNPGMDGPIGPTGATGDIGPVGAPGTNSLVVGSTGPTGSTGSIGPDGSLGPQGATGAFTPLEYFYAYTTATITITHGNGIPWQTSGPKTAGFTHNPGSATFLINTIGKFKVTFTVFGQCSTTSRPEFIFATFFPTVPFPKSYITCNALSVLEPQTMVSECIFDNTTPTNYRVINPSATNDFNLISATTTSISASIVITQIA